MDWRGMLQGSLRRQGYELVRYPIMRFLAQYKINVVLDVGANRGQYAQELRRLGYDKRIVSFEPLSSAFSQLTEKADNDPDWTPVQLAVGSKEHHASLHIAGNSASSSLLDMLPRHTEVAPETAYVGQETVTVKRLDSVFSDYCHCSDKVLLKIDTQGYESEVLQGAAAVLPRIAGLEIEMSLVPLYENEVLAEGLLSCVRKHGFVPFWFNHGFKDPSNQQLLQVNGLFFKAQNERES
ncbi:MAG: FkbM family methyltransferase [Gammaproteobacteria bacterium]